MPFLRLHPRKRTPGCAILAAIEQGVLDEDRWNQYLNLKKAGFVEDKSAYLNEKKTFFKKVKMEMREQYRKGKRQRNRENAGQHR